MRFGAYLLPEDLSQFVKSARCAEQSGYDRIWVVDGPMLYRDPYVFMTHGLAATEHLAFGTAVTNPVTRHPAVTANVFATLDELYPGRAILGIGRGDNAVRTLGLRPLPTGQFEGVLTQLRELGAGRAVTYNDLETKIRWATRDVPLMVAATGPRNLRIAGAFGDIVQVQVGVTPAAVEWAIHHVHAGATAAGRDPTDVQISLICGMWVSDDLGEAREMGRWAAPSVAIHVGDVIRASKGQHDLPVELTRIVEAREAAQADFNYMTDHGNTTATGAGWLTPELIDDCAIVGSADKCLAQIRELEALGVGEIAAAFLEGHDEQISRVGAEVIRAAASS